MSKQQLSQMINNLINDKPEQASTALHDYLAAKMQEVAGIKENYGEETDFDKDFYADMNKITNLLGEALQILNSAKWTDHFENTVTNFEHASEELYTAISNAEEAATDFYSLIEMRDRDVDFAIVGDPPADNNGRDDDDETDEPSPFKDPYRRR